MEELRNINSGRPFGKTAREYLRRGWFPMPLPKGEKYPPPIGFTGRNSKWADEDTVDEWIDNDQATGNIGLHMGPYGEEYTVIGIDVDNYDDKTGGAELADLQRKLGPLPATWTSSSRDDGVSGIRYFLAPKEYEYRGQVAKSIECIQEKHRYAVVYPSWHPNGGQYVWYPPGCAPQGVGGKAWRMVVNPKPMSNGLRTLKFVEKEITGTEIPFVKRLPKLPEKWVQHLSQGGMLASDKPIDMESSVDDIYKWARSKFRQKGGPRKGDPDEQVASLGCSMTRKRVAAWKERIELEPTSHNLLIDAEWNLLCMGLEGHAGWMVAARAIEKLFVEHTVSLGKRGLEEVRGEMFRSRTNALRKIKAQVDNSDLNLLGRKCGCYEGDGPLDGGPEDEFGDVIRALASGTSDSGSGDSGQTRIGSSGLKDPSEYERNDDGNGEHFTDMFRDRFHYVEGYGQWIYWDGKNWRWDEQGLARRAFRRVKLRQQLYAEQLWRDAQMAEAADAPDAKDLKKKAQSWAAWSEQSGNNARAEAALEAATSYIGVTVTSDTVDGREDLLGVENGIIELHPDTGFTFRQATKEDWVVTNTGIPYLSLKEQLQAGGDLAEGVRLWQEYLNLFLPDKEVRAWVQQMMGYTLFGRNLEKKLVFLFGPSNTGKTTMLNAVMAALGGYAGSAEMSIFAPRALNPALAQALPKRIITTTEAGGNGKVDAETLKRITGDDPMSAELKGVNTIITRLPAFVPVLATNNPPQVEGYDDALKQRIEVLPFEVAVPPNKAGGQIKDHSQAAVLAWLVDGWVSYTKNKLLNKPDSLTESRQRFEQEMTGELGEFFEECITITDDENDTVLASEVYSLYKTWCHKASVEHPWSRPVFGKHMSKAGHKAEVKATPKSEGGGTVRVHSKIKLTQSSEKILKFKRNNAKDS